LRDEIARLKELPPRPPTWPSPPGLEKASERAQAKPGQRRRGPMYERRVITREVVLKAAVPAGSRFKGYEDVVVRDLVLEATVIRFRRERWSTPSEARVVAALPPRIVGGFGPLPPGASCPGAGHQRALDYDAVRARPDDLQAAGDPPAERPARSICCREQAVLRAGLASAVRSSASRQRGP